MTSNEKPRRYRRRADTVVTAVQLRLQFDGFDYRKWGGVQSCEQNDWLVDNDGDVYTVSNASFQATYSNISPGRFRKVARVWAVRTSEAGFVQTQEGRTAYAAGDYLVSNDAEGEDRYAIEAARFASLYEPDD